MVVSQIHYLLRSRMDGQYLVAHPRRTTDTEEAAAPQAGFLLLFQEQYEALSYLNTHAPDVADRFAVESVPGTQLGKLLERWGFIGVGLVKDPLTSNIEFLVREK
ncbi:MAG: hypothetical protein ACTS2F_03330 [Thainema sp.]